MVPRGGFEPPTRGFSVRVDYISMDSFIALFALYRVLLISNYTLCTDY